MKLAVVIPAHCHPDILRMTLGSLLRTFTAHDLDIHVGFHFNYQDYCKNTSIFQDLKGVASVHLVDEIDWRQYADNINRYSYMHARHIAFLFKQLRYCDFDYVLLLDDDVLIYQDFVSGLALQGCPDLVGTLFDDVSGVRHGTRGDGTRFCCLPKISPWHLLISRRLYDRIVDEPTVLYPKDIPPEFRRYSELTVIYQPPSPARLFFFDTFADVLHCCLHEWHMQVRTFPSAVFAGWAKHFFFSSFNYGRIASPGRELEIRAAYAREFPDGIAKVFSDYRQTRRF